MSISDEQPMGGGMAGDTLGGDEAPTSNDGTMGADAPAGDVTLNDDSGDDNMIDVEDLP